MPVYLDPSFGGILGNATYHSTQEIQDRFEYAGIGDMKISAILQNPGDSGSLTVRFQGENFTLKIIRTDSTDQRSDYIEKAFEKLGGAFDFVDFSVVFDGTDAYITADIDEVELNNEDPTIGTMWDQVWETIEQGLYEDLFSPLWLDSSWGELEGAYQKIQDLEDSLDDVFPFETRITIYTPEKGDTGTLRFKSGLEETPYSFTFIYPSEQQESIKAISDEMATQDYISEIKLMNKTCKIIFNDTTITIRNIWNAIWTPSNISNHGDVLFPVSLDEGFSADLKGDYSHHEKLEDKLTTDGIMDVNLNNYLSNPGDSGELNITLNGQDFVFEFELQ
jgi:hypothetical protein